MNWNISILNQYKTRWLEVDDYGIAAFFSSTYKANQWDVCSAKYHIIKACLDSESLCEWLNTRHAKLPGN